MAEIIDTGKKLIAATTIVGSAVVGYHAYKIIMDTYNKTGVPRTDKILPMASGIIMFSVAYAAVRYSMDKINS